MRSAPSRRPSPTWRSVASTLASGQPARVTGYPPGRGKPASASPTSGPGSNIWIGVDVGGGGQEGDTAVVWISEQLHVGCQVFSGEDGVLQARDLIEDLAERYRIEEVAFDPWRAARRARTRTARRPVLRVPTNRRPDDPGVEGLTSGDR